MEQRGTLIELKDKTFMNMMDQAEESGGVLTGEAPALPDLLPQLPPQVTEWKTKEVLLNRCDQGSSVRESEV